LSVNEDCPGEAGLSREAGLVRQCRQRGELRPGKPVFRHEGMGNSFHCVYILVSESHPDRHYAGITEDQVAEFSRSEGFFLRAERREALVTPKRRTEYLFFSGETWLSS
jgi:hypothetical protein